MFYRKIDKETQSYLLKNPQYLNQKVELLFTASTDIDQIHKGNFNRNIPEKQRSINNFQLGIYDQFIETGNVKKVFNKRYFTSGDSRDPESAGVASSVMGSVFTILICFLLSFPIAIFASIYLEEFAKSGKVTDLIEININNLAAVPSIIFGLLFSTLLTLLVTPSALMIKSKFLSGGSAEKSKKVKKQVKYS